jgi:hypothetical protein
MSRYSPANDVRMFDVAESRHTAIVNDFEAPAHNVQNTSIALDNVSYDGNSIVSLKWNN